MKKIAFILALIVCVGSSCQMKEATNPLKDAISFAEAEKEIEKVLFDQMADWNKGDIDAFMEGYIKSEDLVFVGRSGLNKGWDQTLANYKKSYPDLATMGKLNFEVLELDSLANQVYRMIGTYELERENDKPTGIFTLIWVYENGKWLISSDQTCG